MNQTKRLIYQILFWLIIWMSQWFLQGAPLSFLTDNIPVYAFQILLSAIVIYYAAPQFLFKNKHLTFVILSLSAIVIFSLIPVGESVPASELPPPPGYPPNIQMSDNLFNFSVFPPSRVFINFLILTISYLLSTFFEGFIYLKKKEDEAILSKTESLETELKLLKSQINPHFLFNSLNNIYALSAIDTNKTQQSISYLSNMLRYVLYECEQKLVPLKKEILYIENYIKLFSLKSSKKYPIEFKIDTKNSDILIAPMLFLPYVENAFKHSNIERRGESFISVEINSNNDNSIYFNVKNSMPTEKMVKDTVGGIGLINVKKRLAILYPEKHRLKISEHDYIYNVELTIQLD